MLTWSASVTSWRNVSFFLGKYACDICKQDFKRRYKLLKTQDEDAWTGEMLTCSALLSQLAECSRARRTTLRAGDQKCKKTEMQESKQFSKQLTLPNYECKQSKEFRKQFDTN